MKKATVKKTPLFVKLTSKEVAHIVKIVRRENIETKTAAIKFLIANDIKLNASTAK